MVNGRVGRVGLCARPPTQAGPPPAVGHRGPPHLGWELPCPHATAQLPSHPAAQETGVRYHWPPVPASHF